MEGVWGGTEDEGGKVMERVRQVALDASLGNAAMALVSEEGGSGR